MKHFPFTAGTWTAEWIDDDYLLVKSPDGTVVAVPIESAYLVRRIIDDMLSTAEGKALCEPWYLPVK